MKFEVPPLPWAEDALAPHISARTVEFHYHKHHLGYMEKLRKAIEGRHEAEKSLEELIRSTSGETFNHAAQVWNHNFYWRSLGPHAGGRPEGSLDDEIRASFGSFDDLKRELGEAANREFGSGWAWLVLDPGGKLRVLSTNDAHTPIEKPDVSPLLTIDVWEHAYYLDYQHERAKYVQAVLDHLLDWRTALANLEAARASRGSLAKA